MSAVVCKGLTKSYFNGGIETRALRGIDLEVPLGELTMLVGPSGCGKTTLISIIAGILRYDVGECSVLGQDLRTMDDRETTSFRGANIGFVFQAYNLIPQLTARENVAVPLLILGSDRKVALDKADTMLSSVGLERERNRKPRDLSGGQQQRVAIARSLIHEPKLIVCDEPTSALDHQTGERVMEILRERAVRPDRSLIIVTHDSRIFSFADKIATMDDGAVISVSENRKL